MKLQYTADNINFHDRAISVIIDEQSFQKVIKKTISGPFLTNFLDFLDKKNCQKIGSIKLNVIAPYQNQGKTNDPILRKQLDVRKDGQTLVYRTLPAIASGPIKSIS